MCDGCGGKLSYAGLSSWPRYCHQGLPWAWHRKREQGRDRTDLLLDFLDVYNLNIKSSNPNHSIIIKGKLIQSNLDRNHHGGCAERGCVVRIVRSSWPSCLWSRLCPASSFDVVHKPSHTWQDVWAITVEDDGKAPFAESWRRRVVVVAEDFDEDMPLCWRRH